ncbi:MAG: hypothetical protein ACI4KM_11985 [Oscillospiraceae bacterium]
MPTTDRITVSPHPHFSDSYILKEKITDGTLFVGTSAELIGFCKQKLAASVNVAELAEMIAAAEKARVIISHAPDHETDFAVKRTIGDKTYEIRLSQSELLDAFMKQQRIGVMEDIRNYIEENELDSDEYDDEIISGITDIYLNNSVDNTAPSEWDIQKAISEYFATHDLPICTEEEPEL